MDQGNMNQLDKHRTISDLVYINSLCRKWEERLEKVASMQIRYSRWNRFLFWAGIKKRKVLVELESDLPNKMGFHRHKTFFVDTEPGFAARLNEGWMKRAEQQKRDEDTIYNVINKGATASLMPSKEAQDGNADIRHSSTEEHFDE